jgi:predicted peptidase
MQYQHDLGHHPAFCTTPAEIHDFVAYAVSHYNVDPNRVYLTGLSCGAFGIWEYVAAYGDTQIAAAVPYAGNGLPAWNTARCHLGSVPLWAFSGALDDVVNPEGSTVPIANLRTCPGIDHDRARVTLYPDFFHEGWDEAYSGALGDDIYSWMLSHARS